MAGTNGEQETQGAGLAVQEPTRRAHRLAAQVQEQTREARQLAVLVQMRAARHLVVMEPSAKASDLQLALEQQRGAPVVQAKASDLQLVLEQAQ